MANTDLFNAYLVLTARVHFPFARKMSVNHFECGAHATTEHQFRWQ